MKATQINANNPIVIVGNGPVGTHAAQVLLQQTQPVVLYGSEETLPYNRVKLSSVLAGQTAWDSLINDMPDEHDDYLQRRYGYTIVAIDPQNKTVTDHQGNIQPYAKLILATGSRPHVPAIPGNDKSSVYTLRNTKDLNELMARQVTSRHAVIIGGGLLGLETARAMGRWNTQITVIEHVSRILSRQVDELSGLLLANNIQQSGINLLLGDGVAEILGEAGTVEFIRLRSGTQLPCDTLIFATGITPNTQLALEAKIAVGRGIRVDDHMQTSVPDVYAIGECCEHRGQVYGLVAPGLEQAGVAAHHILQGESTYEGSIAASRLKVLDDQVLSIGPMGDEATVSYGRNYIYYDQKQGIYRKLLVHRNRLVGVLALGEWSEASRVQTHAIKHRWVLPWQLLRFQMTGSLWPEQDNLSVAAWPASATVCQCTGVNRGRIGEVIQAGAKTCEAVAKETGASTVCGSCKPLIAELVDKNAPLEKAPYAGVLTGSALLAFIVALLFLLPSQIPYQDSVQTAIQWDWLWRDNIVKQVTGYSILGLFGVGLLLSLRKRWQPLKKMGAFDLWRIGHLLLGVAALIVLFAHTGLRMGSGLNLWLMMSFVGLIVLGAMNSGVIGQQHRLDSSWVGRIRAASLNWHIYLFWPVPVLLTFHVISSYWF